MSQGRSRSTHDLTAVPDSLCDFGPPRKLAAPAARVSLENYPRVAALQARKVALLPSEPRLLHEGLELPERQRILVIAELRTSTGKARQTRKRARRRGSARRERLVCARTSSRNASSTRWSTECCSLSRYSRRSLPDTTPACLPGLSGCLLFLWSNV
eukprot:2373570-Prymnesium_polylepis.1